MVKGIHRLILSTALVVTLHSMTAYAVTDNRFSVFVPNVQPGYEGNISALWLKPSASNLNYVILNNELPAESPMWYEQELTPSYAPGFNLGIRRVLPNAGADVNLDWTHFFSSTSETTIAPNDAYFLGPDYQIGPDAIPIHTANGNVKFWYNIVNLDAGQFVNFGEHVSTRFFGGLSAGWLHEQVTATYMGNVIDGAFPGPFSVTQRVSSKFFGMGPRLGIDANVDVGLGFSVQGEAAASALLGSINSLTSYSSAAVELSELFGETVNSQKIKDQAVFQVVPGFSAQLALDYKYAFNPTTLLTVSGGYMAAVYVNAISQYIPATLVEPIQVGGIFVATMSHTLSNYSVQGPFLNIALKFS